MRKLLTTLLAIVLLSLPLRAEAGEGTAGGIVVGTTGIGAGFTLGLTPKMNMRVQGTGYNFYRYGTESGVDYNGKLNLLQVGAMADYYPMNNRFRISGGLFYNGNELKLDG